MSRKQELMMRTVKDFSQALDEFRKQWDSLGNDVAEFMRSLDGNEDPDRHGMNVKNGSWRLAFLTSELMAFHKRMNR